MAKRAFLRGRARIVAGLDPDQDLHRAAGAQQPGERRQSRPGDPVGGFDGQHRGHQQQFVVGEGLPVEIGKPGVVEHRIVEALHFQLGDASRREHLGQVGGQLIEHLGGAGAGVRVGQVAGAGVLTQPATGESAGVDETDHDRVRPPAGQGIQGPFDAAAALPGQGPGALGMVHDRRQGVRVEATALGTQAIPGMARLNGFDRLAPVQIQQGLETPDAGPDLGAKAGPAGGDPGADGVDQQVEGGIASIAQDLRPLGQGLKQPGQLLVQASPLRLRQLQVVR